MSPLQFAILKFQFHKQKLNYCVLNVWKYYTFSLK
jgi:hypothetical protein